MESVKLNELVEIAVKLGAGFLLGWIIFVGNDTLVEIWLGFLDALG